jgi:hypothetical protein
VFAVEIIFIFSLKIKMIATESGKTETKNARTIRSIQKKSIRLGKFTFIVRKSKL